MRFAIYGSGGLGGYYGARLQQAGHEVGFVARGAHLEAMRREGLRVLSPLGDLHIAQPRVSENPAELGQVDAVLVAVKTWQVPDVALAMRPLLRADTMVVPFLNGVESAAQIDTILGAGHALGGLSRIFSLIEAPGVIRHLNQGAYVAFNELDGQPTARLQALREAFESAGVETEIPADINRALWEKLITITSWAGLGTLARSPIGEMRADPATRALIDRSMDETLAVARGRGHAIDEAFKSTLWAFYDALPAGATASLMRDMMAGKPSELEAWNGAVHRFGLEGGVATPTHTMVYQLLAPMERRARARADV